MGGARVTPLALKTPRGVGRWQTALQLCNLESGVMQAQKHGSWETWRGRKDVWEVQGFLSAKVGAGCLAHCTGHCHPADRPDRHTFLARTCCTDVVGCTWGTWLGMEGALGVQGSWPAMVGVGYQAQGRPHP